MSDRISRRQFLKASAVITVGPALLAACVNPALQPAVAPAAGSAALPKVHIWSNMMALARPEGSDPDKLAAVQKIIMEKVGVEVIATVPAPGDAGQEQLNLMLGSQSEEIDIFQGVWDQYKDAIIPLNDLLDEYGSDVKAKNQPEWWSGVTDSEGKIWGVVRLASQLNANHVWVRSDWLEELGLSMPKTFDELEAYIAAFKARDESAVVLTDNINNLRHATVGGFTEFGYSRWFDTSDNKIKPAELQPGYEDWLAKMAEWYEKGWFFKESFAAHDVAEVARGGKVGVFLGWASEITLNVQKVVDAVPGMQFDMVQGIEGPKGFMSTFFRLGNLAIMITKKAKNPEACMKYINWQYQDKDNVLTAAYGVKGVDWDYVDDEKYYITRMTASDAKVYAGEFMTATGPALEPTWAPDDPLQKRHYEFIRDVAWNWSLGKRHADWDVPYDSSLIGKQVPGLADINRLLDEETTKFITGVRPLSEWDAFLEELNTAGLDDWMAAYTEQYLQYKK